MCSVQLKGRHYEEWLVLNSNDNPFYFDEAIDDMKLLFRRLKVERTTQLKHHANTWGLSASNWMAEEIIPLFQNLRALDFSDSLKRVPRSDLC